MPEVTTNVAMLATFIVGATVAACLRFSQESRYSALIHMWRRRAGADKAV